MDTDLIQSLADLGGTLASLGFAVKANYQTFLEAQNAELNPE